MIVKNFYKILYSISVNLRFYYLQYIVLKTLLDDTAHY